MSRAEQYSWASLIALCVVFWWFQTRMLDGMTIVDQPAGALFEIYLIVIAASTFLELVIAAVVARGRSIEKDERDLAIEGRANLNERLFMIGAINVAVWQALWEGLLDGHKLPRIDLTSLPTLIFVLFAILFAGEAVKRLSTIILYRAQAVRG